MIAFVVVKSAQVTLLLCYDIKPLVVIVNYVILPYVVHVSWQIRIAHWCKCLVSRVTNGSLNVLVVSTNRIATYV